MRVLTYSLFAVVILGAVVAGAAWPQGTSQDPGVHNVTAADYERWKTELSNWGRWGKDDELGALNLITPAKRKQAADLVRDGVSVSLAVDANFEKQPNGTVAWERTVTQLTPEGAADRLSIVYHGRAVTHLDAFGHRFFDGKMWNGFSADQVTKEEGAQKGSILNLKPGIFTRGILIDIPRLKGVPYLQPGTRIFPEDLEAWEKKAGIKISAGDAVFIRTGRWIRAAKVAEPDASTISAQAPGLDLSVIPWLKKRDVAVLGGEHPHDAAPTTVRGVPVHDFALIVLGIHLLDNCQLDALSQAAAARNRWEFLLTVAPLPVPGGTGSPTNPIATF